MIELSGVRISCDILWMNVVFIRLFASAISRALRNSSRDTVSSSLLVFSSASETFSLRFRKFSLYRNMNTIPSTITNEIISVVLLCISFSCAWSISSFFSELSFSTLSKVANSLLAICSLVIFNESSALIYICRYLTAWFMLPMSLYISPFVR